MSYKEATQAPGGPRGYPPYVEDAGAPPPPTLAQALASGRQLVRTRKRAARPPVDNPPPPTKPRLCNLEESALPRRAACAQARCLRRHCAVLPDRLERMARPPRRALVHMWREHAHHLRPEIIARLRTMMDADEPLKPDQAYQYFMNMKKQKKKTGRGRLAQAIISDKRYAWAKNATVAFARGIQQRLARPAHVELTGTMERLSDIILADMCRRLHTRPPRRCCTWPKHRFLLEMSDKLAMWIDEILSSADEHMLMMDCDEDEDILNPGRYSGGGDGGDGGGKGGRRGKATANFTPEQLEAFNMLTRAMDDKGGEELLQHGRFKQTYGEGSTELKAADDFHAVEYPRELADDINGKCHAIVSPPPHLETPMKEVVDICSKYLAQYAEFSKDKGPAFRMLVAAMKKTQGSLYKRPIAQRTYPKGGTELEESKRLEADHDDPALTDEIQGKLTEMMKKETVPDALKGEMDDTVLLCSEYLSQMGVEEERGPAFEYLVRELERRGDDTLVPGSAVVESNFAAAYALKTAPGFDSLKPDPATQKQYRAALQEAARPVTPQALQGEMEQLVTKGGNYLSAYNRDRPKAMQAVMKAVGGAKKELASHGEYTLDHAAAVQEIENAPMVVPFRPVKQISDRTKSIMFDLGVKESVAPELKGPVKIFVHDTAKVLSQPVALKGGGGTHHQDVETVTAVMSSLGTRPLFKHEIFMDSFKEGADEITSAGSTLRVADPKSKELAAKIYNEQARGFDRRVTPFVKGEVDVATKRTAEHLAQSTIEKSEALQYLVQSMKGKGDEHLAALPGPGDEKSYMHGAKRLEMGQKMDPTNRDDKVYGTVLQKLKTLVSGQPAPPDQQKIMPVVIDEASKYLASELVPTKYGNLGSATDPNASALDASDGKDKETPAAVAAPTPTSGKSSDLADKNKNLGQDGGDKKSDKGSLDKSRKSSKDDGASGRKKRSSEELDAETAKKARERVLESVISGMQSLGGDPLLSAPGKSESFFFGAQRLKRNLGDKSSGGSKGGDADEPMSDRVAEIYKMLLKAQRCRPMPRSFTLVSNSVCKELAKYLVENGFKEDHFIEAHVALIEEMMNAGEKPLVDRPPKTFGEAGDYLAGLTSFKSKYPQSGSAYKSDIETRLGRLMDASQVTFDKAAMKTAIAENAALLGSYLENLGERPKHFKELADKMEAVGRDVVLMRHGNAQRSFLDGAGLLRNVGDEHLSGDLKPDQVVERKLALKMRAELGDKCCAPELFDEATKILAVFLPRGGVTGACACTKNIFVQCELWCDEKRRRLRGRPCCRCRRRASAQAMSDFKAQALAPDVRLRLRPCEHVTVGYGLSTVRLPSGASSYLDHTLDVTSPPTTSGSDLSDATDYHLLLDEVDAVTHVEPHDFDSEPEGTASDTQMRTEFKLSPISWSSDSASRSSTGTSGAQRATHSSDVTNVSFPSSVASDVVAECLASVLDIQETESTMLSQTIAKTDVPSLSGFNGGTRSLVFATNLLPCREPLKSSFKHVYNLGAPIVTPQRSGDWRAMVVSHVWNLRAWRDWLQQHVDRALRGENSQEQDWAKYATRVLSEAMQWRQYYMFSRSLTIRLALQCWNKQNRSPTRTSDPACTLDARQLSQVVDMFNKWTRWLCAVVEETDKIDTVIETERSLTDAKWSFYKEKVEELSKDWRRYRSFLNTSWEGNFGAFLSKWVPVSEGLQWVWCADGAVPSGAASAGILDGDVVWTARAWHGGAALPGALSPARGGVTVYADGEELLYTKYQVLCSGGLAWVPWRGAAGALAAGAPAGRVLHRGAALVGAVRGGACRVALCGRPCRFACYELLVRAPLDD